MFNRILVLCTGNICRSPVAAALLRQRLPHRQIESAGLEAVKNGAADATACELAAQEGLDLAAHRARQLSPEMIQQADLILVMSENQRRAIADKHPAATGKVMLFGRWLSNAQTGAQGTEIPDPYRKSREAFSHVHSLLVQAADSWQSRLR